MNEDLELVSFMNRKEHHQNSKFNKGITPYEHEHNVETLHDIRERENFIRSKRGKGPKQGATSFNRSPVIEELN